MQISKAARRYARALFLLARERALLDEIGSDLEGLLRLLREVPDFAAVVKHPLLPAAQRQRALDAVLDDRVHELTRTFLRLLEDKDRLVQLEGICLAFAGLYREERGIEQAEVVSAAVLEPAQQDRIRERLAERLGKKVEMTARVDPALIGGFRIKVKDTVFDYSLATRLHNFKQKLMHA